MTIIEKFKIITKKTFQSACISFKRIENLNLVQIV